MKLRMHDSFGVTGLGLIVYMFAALVVTVGGSLCLANEFSEAACSQVSEQTGKSTDYRFLTGCYVDIDGEWVPADKWRESEESR